MRVEVIPSEHLDTDTRDRIRGLLDAAFGERFSATDWKHTLGGSHFVIREGGRLISHAAIVARTLKLGDVAMRAGYVEGVATDPRHERRGHGSAVMRRVADALREAFEIGALSTGSPALYTRLGWEQWRGPTFVDAPGGRLRTEEDDGGIYVLRTSGSVAIDLSAAIACDWRTGDVW
jgi:aminoglycoside 2'-N-acetyltransferase I